MKSETAPLAELPRMLAEELFDLQEAGRIMHESWTATKRSQGFHGPEASCSLDCFSSVGKKCPNFHADLIPWDDLQQKQKDINLNAFKDVFAVLTPKSESVIRRAMLAVVEKAEEAVYFALYDDRGAMDLRDAKALKDAVTAIRELAQQLKG